MEVLSHKVIIRKSNGERYGFVGVSGCFLFLALIFAVVFFMFPSPTNVTPGTVYGLLGVVFVLFLSSFLVAGPTDLELNPGNGTYRYTRGMPLLAKTSTGAITEISAIVCRVDTGRGTTYQVQVEWVATGRKSPIGIYTQDYVQSVFDSLKAIGVSTRWDDWK